MPEPIYRESNVKGQSARRITLVNALLVTIAIEAESSFGAPGSVRVPLSPPPPSVFVGIHPPAP